MKAGAREAGRLASRFPQGDDLNAIGARAGEILLRLPWHNPAGAEIGVFQGGLSRALLSLRKDLTLHMIDSWGGNQSESFKATGDYHSDKTQAEQDHFEHNARESVRFAEGRAHIVKSLSVDAAKDFQDKSLDFAFIDADHSYEGCKADLAAWYPKIRPGGWLCGHDYANYEFPFGPLVKRAVDEFASARGLSVELGTNFTWFMKLPGERKIERLPWDVTVACVKWGKKYGPEYVNILREMVAKNLSVLHRFVCLTDDAEGLAQGIEIMPLPKGLDGWWNKLALFQPGRFEGRVIYLDLDVCVTGNLDELASRDGIIKDWHLEGYNSSVISWEAGKLDHLWTHFDKVTVPLRLAGDQDWITEQAKLPVYPKSWCLSHIGCETWPPNGAKVVCFHGAIKPHLKPYPWVELIWSKDGMAALEFDGVLNMKHEEMLKNMRANLARGLPSLPECAPHDRIMCIVGGGPSIKDTLSTIRLFNNPLSSKGKIFALNGAHDYLIERGIVPHAQVIADARPENVTFVKSPHNDVTYYIASVCDHSVFDALDGHEIVTWTPDLTGMQDALDAIEAKSKLMVGGGPTVGLKALCIGYALGYRHFHLHGFDSSFADDQTHAYEQKLNARDERIEAFVSGRKFVTSPSMFRQAQVFRDQAMEMVKAGCVIDVYGDGLLPWLAKTMSRKQTEPQAA